MAIRSDAQRKAVAKYNSKNYDQIQLRVPKGEKEAIQTHAENMGESVNAFIYRAIQETMKKDL